MVVLPAYEHFNYEDSLMNKKLVAIVVGCLSFSAVQAMELLVSEHGDIWLGEPEETAYRSICQFIKIGDFNQTDAYIDKFKTYCNSFGSYGFNPNRVYLNDMENGGKPILLQLGVNQELTVSLYSSIAWLICCNELPLTDFEGGPASDKALAFLREVKEILNLYKPEVLPENGRYAWERMPKSSGNKALLVAATTGALVVGWGIWKLFFAEDKKRPA